MKISASKTEVLLLSRNLVQCSLQVGGEVQVLCGHNHESSFSSYGRSSSDVGDDVVKLAGRDRPMSNGLVGFW